MDLGGDGLDGLEHEPKHPVLLLDQGSHIGIGREDLRYIIRCIHRGGAYTGTVEDTRTVPHETEIDRTEAVRIAAIAIALALNLGLLWWQWKDTAEGRLLRARMSSWWDRNFAGPARRARALAKMESEVVFEAIQTVEGTQ